MDIKTRRKELEAQLSQLEAQIERATSQLWATRGAIALCDEIMTEGGESDGEENQASSVGSGVQE